MSTSLDVSGMPTDIKSIKPSVGHGVVVSPTLCTGGTCAHAGRMVVPMVCTNASAVYPATIAGDKGIVVTTPLVLQIVRWTIDAVN